MSDVDTSQRTLQALESCPYCAKMRQGDMECGARGKRGSGTWRCTRPIGHVDPDHVACAVATHKMAVWR